MRFADRNKSMKPRIAVKKPWYKRKWVWIILVLLSLATGIYVAYLRFQYEFYRPIEVTRGPWQVLDPGQPMEPLKFEVVKEGNGPVVEPGDLIQLTLSSHYYHKDGKPAQWDSDWWLWVGFRNGDETPFHAVSPRLNSAFVGQREGGWVKFPEPRIKGHSEIGWMCIAPFGGCGTYANSKRGLDNDSRSRRIPTPNDSSYMEIFVKKVFKGQLRYRTTHLYDDTWFHYCYDGLKCEFTSRPREAWSDVARYDGVSADGQTATFQYVSVPTPWQPWTHPSGNEWIRAWRDPERKNIPVGVQVK